MQKLRTVNVHTTAEAWLQALINELRPVYAACGLIIPEKIRGAIAFTSHGKLGAGNTQNGQGTWPAECWPAAATDDGFCEIIVRADYADPLAIAKIVAHELIHACLPDAKHGKTFRDAALRLGFEGPMRSTLPGAALSQRLNELLTSIGPLPRARLNFDLVTIGGLPVADRPKKQTTRMLKAECLAAGCGYPVPSEFFFLLEAATVGPRRDPPGEPHKAGRQEGEAGPLLGSLKGRRKVLPPWRGSPGIARFRGPLAGLRPGKHAAAWRCRKTVAHPEGGAAVLAARRLGRAKDGETAIAARRAWP